MDSILDGVKAQPELFTESSKDVPDINFFYRYSLRRRSGGRRTWISCLSKRSKSQM